MIEFLKNWVTNIVMLIVFISMIEIILPNTNMKRYINMIIGLLIIIVIINPFIGLFTKDINLEKEVFKNIMGSNDILIEDNEDIKNIQEEQVIEVYKRSLENEINETISTKLDYKIINIKINIVEDRSSDDYGMIKELSMVVTKDIVKNSDKNIEVEEIKKVSVDIGNKKEIKNEKDGSLEEFNDIKNILSDQYSIPKNSIIISKNS